MSAYVKPFPPQHTFPDTETHSTVYWTATAVIKATPHLSPTQSTPSHASRLYTRPTHHLIKTECFSKLFPLPGHYWYSSVSQMRYHHSPGCATLVTTLLCRGFCPGLPQLRWCLCLLPPPFQQWCGQATHWERKCRSCHISLPSQTSLVPALLSLAPWPMLRSSSSVPGDLACRCLCGLHTSGVP